LRGAVPRRVAPRALLQSHAAMGAIAFVPVVLFVATGAVMAFYQPTAHVMSRVLAGRVPVQPDARVPPRKEATAAWPDILTVLDATLPEGEAVYYYPGTRDNARVMFRKRLPDEWHPNGRSYIVMDPYTTAVVQTIDARAQDAGTRLMNKVYPVHAATVGGVAMTGLAALAALALSWLAAGGAWSYAARRLASRRQRRIGPVPAIASSMDLSRST
jgi:hypothetical protein